MRKLTFSSINERALDLVDDDGEHYSLALSEELRSAVRESAPRRAVAEEAREYRPKDIQQLLRAGASVDEICEWSGLPVSHVQRFEGPVIAERNWTIESAHGFVVGHSSDSPALGDLVIDRLATRHVSEIEWDAVREGTEPWRLIARYVVANAPVEATWEVDLSTRSVRALDDESRWLSETDASSPRARRHLAASVLYNSEEDGVFPAASDDSEESTDSLLRHLHSSRGVRQREEDLLAHILDGDMDEIPAAHPPLSAPEQATDALVLPLPNMPTPPSEDAAQEAQDEPTVRRPRSRRRQSVPSWDEIVFGSDS
ncbi:MAG: DUF3071 domain-containing protein [Ruaniaceae bacterium]|nr:DUF3071 domain-containing protein [Ruaniaceae bacterium]